MAEYKIKDIELLTGIKAHTIRIWEKRYKLLEPVRTETQIRTYNDAELVILLNIATLNKNGLKISHIAEMSERERLTKVNDLSTNITSDAHIEQLILALIELDEALFRNTLNSLIEHSGLSSVFQKTIIPFLERIGVMWLVGSINTAQEHFISNLIRQRVISEIDRLPSPKASQQKAILFQPEHEWHELSLLMYHFHLRSKGINTFYLGQSLPYDSLVESVKFIKPQWILSSWLTSIDSNFIVSYFEKLKKDLSTTIIVAGGIQIKNHFKSIEHLVKSFKSLDELDELIH